jgi:AraC family transcriptional regulator
VLAGSWSERYDGGVRTCAPRSVIYHPAGEIHSDSFDREGARLFDIELDPSWLQRIAGTSQSFDQPHAFDGGQVSTTALRLYDEAHRNDALSPLVIEGLMLELLGACLRTQAGVPRSAPPDWIRDIERTLRSDFQTPPSLGALATQAGVHPVHLARVFRRKYGQTIGDFVRQCRLDFVCQQLVSSKRPIAELAIEAGFADQSHLTKAFSRTLGTTPARYRAATRLT